MKLKSELEMGSSSSNKKEKKKDKKKDNKKSRKGRPTCKKDEDEEKRK